MEFKIHDRVSVDIPIWDYSNEFLAWIRENFDLVVKKDGTDPITEEFELCIPEWESPGNETTSEKLLTDWHGELPEELKEILAKLKEHNPIMEAGCYIRIILT